MGLSNKRIGYDNCKLVFMYLVLIWHIGHLSILKERTAENWSQPMIHFTVRYWQWTERTAVPGFVFLSGFFAKAFLQEGDEDPIKTRKRWEKSISMLLVGALLWQFLYYSFGQVGEYVMAGTFKPFLPHHSDVWEDLYTWYLIALFLWRLMTPLLKFVRHPTLIALFLSFLSAHTNHGWPLQMRNRLFFFFPFYTAGLQCPESWLEQRRGISLLGIIGILTTFGICLVVPDESNVENDVLSWKYSIDSWDIYPHCVLLFQYILGGVSALSIIFVVRHNSNIPFIPYTHAGSSLAIYEWHWPVVGFITWGSFPFTNHRLMEISLFSKILIHLRPIPALVVIHIVCYLCCVILGNRYLYSKVLRHVCEPNCQWLFRQPERSVVETTTMEQSRDDETILPFHDRLPLIHQRSPVSV